MKIHTFLIYRQCGDTSVHDLLNSNKHVSAHIIIWCCWKAFGTIKKEIVRSNYGTVDNVLDCDIVVN